MSSKNKKLVKQIASMVEYAYRRGFQHGVNSEASDEQARWFRYNCRSAADADKAFFTYSTYAPENTRRYIWKGGEGHTCLDRLKMEIPNSDTYAELIALILEVESK